MKTNDCQWLPIYDNAYVISSSGVLARPGLKRVVKQRRDSSGNVLATVKVDGRSVTVRIANLVAQAFIGQKQQRQKLVHRDGNKENNCCENLEYTWKPIPKRIYVPFTGVIEGECWRRIANTPYAVSDHGRITNCGDILHFSPGGQFNYSPDKKGYLRASVGGVSVPVHALVAALFIGPRPTGHEINHIDGDKANNSVSNLEYVTPKQNTHHAFHNGLRKCKLSEPQIAELRARIASGESQRSIAKSLECSPGHVGNIVAGRRRQIYWGNNESN